MEKIKQYYKGKKVLITGHTGFKGTWFSRFLIQLGADVYGIGLKEGDDQIFALTQSENDINSSIQNICDYEATATLIKKIDPEVIFHLAAQPLVLKSYTDPIDTFNSNVMGTIHVLEAARSLTNLKAMVMITTDKVYHNNEWVYPYRETDKLGGYDPYSASKAMCELAISSYVHSFFNTSSVGITSVRAGNVIGGGDFAENRIIPDVVRSIQSGKNVSLRSPNSIRPWQHVLDVIWAYLLVGTKILEKGETPSSSYNIAPLDNSDTHTVEYIVKKFISVIEQGTYEIDKNANFAHEMGKLRLDPSLIQAEVQWSPLFNTEEAIEQTAQEYKQYLENPTNLKEILDNSIKNYLNDKGVL